jgi:hypothetical protein
MTRRFVSVRDAISWLSASQWGWGS